MNTETGRQHQFLSAVAPHAEGTEPELYTYTQAPAEESGEFALIMKGGGAKGLAYVGALQILQRHYNFTWFVGTSSGAIAAVLLAAGYTADELEPILSRTPFKTFMDAKWYKWPLNLLLKKGLFPALVLNNWLEGVLNAKVTPGSGAAVRLEQLKNRCTIYAARRGTEALEFDSRDPATKGKEAVLAVRASVAIPYIFQPQTDSEQRVYDGGLRHNFPLLAFLNKHNKAGALQFLGLYLGSPVYRHQSPARFVLFDLLEYWLSGSDQQALKDYAEQIIIIDPSPVSTLRFNLSQDERDFLLAAGRAAALAYLARQSRLESPPSADEVIGAKELADGLRAKAMKAYKARARRWKILSAFLLVALTALLLTASKWVYDHWSERQRVAVPITSVAVLPFIDEVNGSNDEVLRDGTAEILITNLGQLSQLSVRPRSSSFKLRFKGDNFDAKRIGQELNVQALVTGNVTRRGNSLMLHVELIDVRTVSPLWAEDYPYMGPNLASLPGEAALGIARALIPNLSRADEEKVMKKFTVSDQAYQHYLRGLSHLGERTAGFQNIEKAILEFGAATDKDPDYALAYVGLADCYVLLEGYAGAPPTVTLPRAEEYVTYALTIDQSLAEGHATLGLVYAHRWQWNKAEEEFRKAITLKPNYARTYHWYYMVLRNQGRYEEALAQIKLAQTLDPLSALIGGNLGHFYWLKGDLSSAVAQYRKVIDQNRNDGNAHTFLGLTYLELGRKEEALREVQIGSTYSGNSGWLLCLQGYVLAVAGKRNEAAAIIKKLEARHSKREEVSQQIVALTRDKYFTESHEEAALGFYIAIVYAGLGENKQAFDWLDKDLKIGASGLLPFIQWMPVFKSLRDDPRFASLLREMNLPQETGEGERDQPASR